MRDSRFRWPEGFRPTEARVYVRNVRHIHYRAQSVWETLVRARSWPLWYPNASNVRLPGDVANLASGMVFHWTQSGIALRSEVREFEPPTRIAWFARSPWIQAYHAWDIHPERDMCTVVTEETQRGILPFVFGTLVRRRMLAIHERWLELLEENAGATYDMSVPLPPERTVAEVVDLVLGHGPPYDSDAIDAKLSAEFSLSAGDAALARDRTFGGVVRAATRNIANRPDPVDDPIAYESFERAWNDPSIVARHRPD